MDPGFRRDAGSGKSEQSWVGKRSVRCNLFGAIGLFGNGLARMRIDVAATFVPITLALLAVTAAARAHDGEDALARWSRTASGKSWFSPTKPPRVGRPCRRRRCCAATTRMAGRSSAIPQTASSAALCRPPEPDYPVHYGGDAGPNRLRCRGNAGISPACRRRARDPESFPFRPTRLPSSRRKPGPTHQRHQRLRSRSRRSPG